MTVGAEPAPEAIGTRRERQRAATTAEIKATARRLLVADGAGELSLRAIAREMGMTAPGLYRYFASREDLVKVLIRDLYDEVCDEMEAARDTRPADDPADRLLTVSRTFRTWSLRHPVEFELIFGNAAKPPQATVAEWYRDPETGPQRRFAGIFG